VQNVTLTKEGSLRNTVAALLPLLDVQMKEVTIKEFMLPADWVSLKLH